ncbi:Uncharacterised protein [Pseudomonas fluorescens]|uniref:Uncharacterized protein n=1 Tax=Pseudomonas fluorescens TaxID=294 RepID=A0A379I552_PSEFL|nr:hypothetical protein HZ99_18080 [Pseudomonas fluorescens]SUD27098.1 Uncharacterised protein [Pseudomonas fluorescens]
MLAKIVNDNAFILNERGVLEIFASKLAPTFFCAHFSNFLAETITPFLSLLSFVTIHCYQNDKPLHEVAAQIRDYMMRCHHV